MKTLTRALLLLLPVFSGCMKIRQEFVVFPDGSGKMTLSFSIRSKSDAGRLTQEMLMSGDPDEVFDKIRGVVAMTKPVAEDQDGVVRIRSTFYFEDLSAVKFMDEDPAAPPKQTFSFKKEGEGFLLTAAGNLLSDAMPERPDRGPEVEKHREEIFKAMFVGFEFVQGIRMPGPVTSVEGYQSKEDRTASYRIGEGQLQKPADQKSINQTRRFSVVCGPSVIEPTDRDAFRQELTKAKADWIDLRAEMKRNAEKRK